MARGDVASYKSQDGACTRHKYALSCRSLQITRQLVSTIAVRRHGQLLPAAEPAVTCALVMASMLSYQSLHCWLALLLTCPA